MQRRTLLKSSLLLPLLNLKSYANDIKDKHVIIVWLGGGMSHSDNFNIAPEAVDGYKSIVGHIQAKNGLIGSLWTEMAKLDFSLVHSFGHINPGHQGGTAYVLNGYNFTDENEGARQTHPSIGSLVSKKYGTITSGVPTYVAEQVFGTQSSYLGNVYNPFNIDSEDNLTLTIPHDRFAIRKAILEQINNYNNTPAYIDKQKEQAFQILGGNIQNLFLVDKENPSRKLYGDSVIGKRLIVARQLIERGTRVVLVSNGGWDMHQGIEAQLKYQVPIIDKALSGLLIDLEQRSLLQDTLVVVATEFGRTKLNNGTINNIAGKPGRDHWSRLTPLLLAGGGYSGNIGTMDKNGFEPKDSPYSPIDLLYTILSFCKIDKSTTNTDLSGRPRYIIEENAKIIQKE